MTALLTLILNKTSASFLNTILILMMMVVLVWAKYFLWWYLVSKVEDPLCLCVTDHADQISFFNDPHRGNSGNAAAHTTQQCLQHRNKNQSVRNGYIYIFGRTKWQFYSSTNYNHYTTNLNKSGHFLNLCLSCIGSQ